MPYIIMKKVHNGKSFSLHGSAVSRTVKEQINEKLSAVHRVESAQPLAFEWDAIIGHYRAEMNTDYARYHEEDALAAILDSMEALEWRFRFEAGGAGRDVYIFSKDDRLHL